MKPFHALALVSFLLITTSCNEEVISGDNDASIYDKGADGGPGTLTGDGPLPGDGGILVPTPDGGTRVCYITPCGQHVYQCGDCIDNDGDGLIDSDDPDCLNQCHNTEEGLAPMIPGDNNAPCKKTCFFDQSSGGGNNGCYWDHRCDPHEKAPDYYPEGSACSYNPKVKIPGTSMSCDQLEVQQSAMCHSVCDPLTPNGCDCFGCCALGSQTDLNHTPPQGIYLGSRDGAGNPSCFLNKVNDPAACHPCQIVTGCFKPCGRCQLCVGKNTVPADCLSGGGRDGGSGGGDGGVSNPAQCPGGQQACGLPGQPGCPAGFYCISGCCQPTIG